jgi:hypothetical protein
VLLSLVCLSRACLGKGACLGKNIYSFLVAIKWHGKSCVSFTLPLRAMQVDRREEVLAREMHRHRSRPFLRLHPPPNHFCLRNGLLGLDPLLRFTTPVLSLS